MRKKQTRRVVSMRSQVYVRFKNAADRLGRSSASLAEECLGAFLDGLGEPEVDREEAVERVTKRTEDGRRVPRCVSTSPFEEAP